MAGHSKWANIQHRKSRQDAKKGKEFTKAAKEIILAAKVREPARITRYVYELATLFHKFYNACRVKCDDDSLMQARLTLCQCALTTLANALAILKVDAPENM